jgi:hypothetical protein
MQHTLIAVFDNRSDAQKAMDELLQCGFARDEVRLTEDTGASVGGQSSAAADTQDEGVTAKVKHFFTDLFRTLRQIRDRGHPGPPRADRDRRG